MQAITPQVDARKNSERPILSVVIPAFNESERLPPTIARIGGYLADKPDWLPAEIIVVDDGSSDDTAAAAKAVDVPAGSRLEVFVHAENRGKGAAVRTGFARTTGDWVLLTDADLSAPIAELPKLTRAAAEGGVAVGSRSVERQLIENPQPWYRDLMGRSFNLAVRTLGLADLGDTQCGFKLFPGDLARSLSSAQKLDGFAFDVELLVLARHWGFPVHEVGVRWQHVEASRVQAVRHSSQMLRDVLRIWMWRASSRLPALPGPGS